MVENSILKQNARNQLGGNIFANTWLMCLVVCLVNSAIINFAGSFFGIGTLIVIGPMTYGLTRITTGIVCGKNKIDMADLFKGFSEDITNTIILGLITTLYTFLWGLLLVVPGIVKSYSYSMASYIQQDQPNKEWKYCLDESIRMMDGYKWKLFCLDISFIGWYIVGALCLGVGVLFVEPYHETARANFYLALKAAVNPNPAANQNP